MEWVGISEIILRILEVGQLGFDEGVELSDIMLLSRALAKNVPPDNLAHAGPVNPFDLEILQSLRHQRTVNSKWAFRRKEILMGGDDQEEAGSLRAVSHKAQKLDIGIQALNIAVLGTFGQAVNDKQNGALGRDVEGNEFMCFDRPDARDDGWINDLFAKAALVLRMDLRQHQFWKGSVRLLG